MNTSDWDRTLELCQRTLKKGAEKYDTGVLTDDQYIYQHTQAIFPWYNGKIDLILAIGVITATHMLVTFAVIAFLSGKFLSLLFILIATLLMVSFVPIGMALDAEKKRQQGHKSLDMHQNVLDKREADQVLFRDYQELVDATNRYQDLLPLVHLEIASGVVTERQREASSLQARMMTLASFLERYWLDETEVAQTEAATERLDFNFQELDEFQQRLDAYSEQLTSEQHDDEVVDHKYEVT